MQKRKLAMLVAEMTGAFVLSVVVLSISRYGLPIFTALAVAVALGTMVTSVGVLSGAHFNPAVTLGAFSMRLIGPLKTAGYVAAQAVGAVLAWKLYEWMVDAPIVSNTPTEFDWRIFVAEMAGTFVFGFAIAAAWLRKLDSMHASFTIGAGLFLGATVASLVSAAGVVNPAVAMAIGYRPDHVGYLAYLLGPVVGAVAGMNFYRYAVSDEAVKERVVTVPGRSVAAKVATTKKPAVRKKTAAKKPAARRTRR